MEYKSITIDRSIKILNIPIILQYEQLGHDSFVFVNINFVIGESGN